ncbi:SRPBCC domain-containing protein, partial [Rhizobiaceae sp. 2RAB30]
MAASIEARVLADDELFITRTFDAPVAVVWRLWEDPTHMIRWWEPEGFTVTELGQDFRPGGAWRICMASEAYPISWSSGRFIELDRHKPIVRTFAWED